MRVAGVGQSGRMDGVVFDLDGVLVDSERWWDEVRRGLAAEHGRPWPADATTAMIGMSTPEWARYLVEVVGVPLPPDGAARTVIDRMAERYEEGPPLLPGAVEAVREAAGRGPVGIASSSPPRIIRAFLDATGLLDVVRVAMSSEQAGAGKPDPAVYLMASAALGLAADRCVAVEDSTNGLKAALAAGMTVLALPNPHFPPDPDVLAQAAAVLTDLAGLPAALDRLQVP
jgi:HAD superfamily hydrolase (TIGR01509 family)